MTVKKAISLVQKNLTPDLLQGRWKHRQPNAHPLEGHCYIAAEALWHLLGPKDWKPMCASYEDEYGKATHWWLVKRSNTNIIADPTKEQYEPDNPPYHIGKGSGFLTTKPSKRAQIVLNRINNNEQQPIICEHGNPFVACSKCEGHP